MRLRPADRRHEAVAIQVIMIAFYFHLIIRRLELGVRPV
jgi:hypothetical protein